MSYTNGLDKPSDYFNTVLWTGNSGSQTITGVGFQPDFLWTKVRSDADHHQLRDAVRGINKVVRSSSTGAEYTVTSAGAFNSDGFTTTGTNGTEWNYNGSTYASWCWLANNTSGSSNTDGSYTSTVSANTTSGFSIVSYTGTGSAGTVGHGLGVTPKMIISKNLTNSSAHWGVYHHTYGATKYLLLNDTGAVGTDSGLWNDTEPTSSVFSVGTYANAPFIAYVFAEKKGFSKFGSYTGNGSTDGTFVYTGFKPAFIIIKRTDAIQSWVMFDNKRIGYNPNNYLLFPNASSTEGTSNYIDILSNGFKPRTTDPEWNGSGASYIYMCFAEHPLVSSSGVPCTAR